MNTPQQQQQHIVTFQEPTRAHYFLRGCGPLRPLTEAECRRLRLAGVTIDLPVTAPLGSVDTAVSGRVEAEKQS